MAVHPPKLLVGPPPQVLQTPGFALDRRTRSLRLLPELLGRLPGILQQVAGLPLGLGAECLGRPTGLLRGPGPWTRSCSASWRAAPWISPACASAAVMIWAASASASSTTSWARSAASTSIFSADRPASSMMSATCVPRWLNDGCPWPLAASGTAPVRPGRRAAAPARSVWSACCPIPRLVGGQRHAARPRTRACRAWAQ